MSLRIELFNLLFVLVLVFPISINFHLLKEYTCTLRSKT